MSLQNQKVCGSLLKVGIKYIKSIEIYSSVVQETDLAFYSFLTYPRVFILALYSGINILLISQVQKEWHGS